MRSFLNDVEILVPAIRTLATIAGAYLVGRLLTAVVAGRLTRIARSTQGQWDDVVIRALSTRIPLWSVLAGCWLSEAYWPLTERWVGIVSTLLSSTWLASLTFAASAIASRLVVIYGAHAMPGATVSGLTQNLVRLIIVSFGVLVILNGFGIEIRPMLAALGVGGLAVALALQEPLSNLFAGLFVTMSGQLRIGDFVRLDSGIEGRITDFNWRSTSLALGTGSTAVVPNAKLSQAIVTNFDLPSSEINVSVDVVVDFDCDAAAVEAIALETARAVQTSVAGAVADFHPSVRFTAFGDVGLRATAVLRAKTLGDQPLVRHEFISRLHGAFRQHGIVIPTLVPPAPK